MSLIYGYQNSLGCTRDVLFNTGCGNDSGANVYFIESISKIFSLLLSLMITEDRYATIEDDYLTSEYYSKMKLPEYDFRNDYSFYDGNNFKYPWEFQNAHFAKFMELLYWGLDRYREDYNADNTNDCYMLKKINEFLAFISNSFFGKKIPSPIQLSYWGDSTFENFNMENFRGELLDGVECTNPKEYVLFWLKRVPSKINYEWYKAAWCSLMEVVKTSNIDIGGGWKWLSPILTKGYYSSFLKPEDFSENTGKWLSSENALLSFEQASIGKGISSIYSISGCKISKDLYYSDSYTDRLPEENVPILSWLLPTRNFIGATDNFADINGLSLTKNLFPDYEYSGGCGSVKLEIGTDYKHWSAEGRSEATTEELSAYPVYSWSAKPYRESNGLIKTIKICNTDDICKPPIRLVKENIYTLMMTWEKFFCGNVLKTSLSGCGDYVVFANSDYIWNRQHYVKDYQLKIRGQAEIINAEEYNGTIPDSLKDCEYLMTISQNVSEESETDGEWILAGKNDIGKKLFADYSGNTNTLYYRNGFSYIPPAAQLPEGNSNIGEDFGDLSGICSLDENRVVVIDTEIPKGFNDDLKKNFLDYISALKKLFPKSEEQNKHDAEADLSALYVPLIENLKSLISSNENYLSSMLLEFSISEQDSWVEAYYMAIGDVTHRRAPTTDFDDFSSNYPDNWDGRNPSPMLYFNLWATDLNVINYTGENITSDEDGRLYCPGLHQETFPNYGCDTSYCEGILKLVKSECAARLSADDKDYFEETIDDIINIVCHSDTALSYIKNGFAVDIENLLTIYGPEYTEGVVDLRYWKSVIKNINSTLYTSATQHLLNTSYTVLYDRMKNLLNDKTNPDKKDKVMRQVLQVKSEVDSDLLATWIAYYQGYKDDRYGSLEELINNLIEYIAMLYEQLLQLIEEYENALSFIEDNVSGDDFPLPEELMPLYSHYYTYDSPLEGEKSFEASLTFSSLMPDSLNNGFYYDRTDLNGKYYYLQLEINYDCIYPYRRYPVLEYDNATYYTYLKRKYIDEELSSREEYKSCVKSYTNLHNSFDQYREDSMTDIDNEVGSILGDVNKDNYFGKKPSNLDKYSMLALVGLEKELSDRIGIDYIGADYSNIYGEIVLVKFGDEVPISALAIYVDMKSGWTFHTLDMLHGSFVGRNRRNSKWKIKDTGEDISKWGKFPDDWEVPLISNDFTISQSTSILCRNYYNGTASIL